MQNSDFPSLRSSFNDLFSNIVQPPSYAAKLNKSCQELPIKVHSSNYTVSAEDFPELSRAKLSKRKKKGKDKSLTKTTTKSKEILTKVPSSMIKDHFGIAGLLSYIRQPDNDKDRTILVPGIDLTTLGLNMNSSSLIHSDLLSPFTNEPNCLHREDDNIPEEYRINEFIGENLSQINIVRYGIDVLFFQFYFQPGDVIQTLAAYELYRRGWRYLIDSKSWIARLPGTKPYQRTPVQEHGRYYVFDPSMWERKVRELVIQYDKLDKKPIIYRDFLNLSHYVPIVNLEELDNK